MVGAFDMKVSTLQQPCAWSSHFCKACGFVPLGTLSRRYDFWYQPRLNVMVSSEWGAPSAFTKV